MVLEYEKVFISGLKNGTTVYVRVESATPEYIDLINRQAKENAILACESRGGSYYIQNVRVK